MKLYGSRIPIIARDIIHTLTSAGDIDVADREEAELDVQAVLKEYLRAERDLTEETKDVMERRGLDHGAFGKIKRTLAERKGLPLGDEGVIWMCGQILETFMQSKFIEEVYAEDVVLRRKMLEIIQRHMLVEEELDEAVRQRIKNLTEDTVQWDIEYARTLEQLKRRRGIS